MDNLHSVKTGIINEIQKYFDESQRLNESTIQLKCEYDLTLRENSSTIRNQESILKEKQLKIEGLEKSNMAKDKQIHEYSELINNFEQKVQELTLEKSEKERFDIIRNQANTIQAKENEINRLTNLLQKLNEKETNEQEKKVLNVFELIEKDVPDDDITVKVIKNDDSVEEEEKEEKEEEEDEDEDEDEDEEEEYEILVYRKKEYWIKKDEFPQYIYEVIEEDGLGDRLGIYKKDKNGKLKVFLDK